MGIINESFITALDETSSPETIRDILEVMLATINDSLDGNALNNNPIFPTSNRTDRKSIFGITLGNIDVLGSKDFDDPIMRVKLPEHLPPIEVFGATFFIGKNGVTADCKFQFFVNDVPISEQVTVTGENTWGNAAEFSYTVVSDDVLEVKIEEIGTPDYVRACLWCRASLPRLPVV